MIFFIKLKNFGFKRAFVWALIRTLTLMRVFLYKSIISDNKPFVRGAKIFQATQFVGKGVIELNMSQIGVWPSPGLLSGSSFIEARGVDSVVRIGASTFINNNCTIIADRTEILIGNNCLIGPNFFVVDSDFHGIQVKNRLNGQYKSHPVKIMDNVFIGEGVKVLKGVTIGQGSVIASGSVVVQNVDEHCLYAGVPARKVSVLN